MTCGATLQDCLAPLGLATFRNRADVVRLLVSSGASFESIDYSHNPLFIAAKNGNLEIFEYLLRNGAPSHTDSNAQSTLLHEAIYGGNMEIIRSVIQLGIDINTNSNVSIPSTIPVFISSYSNLLLS